MREREREREREYEREKIKIWAIQAHLHSHTPPQVGVERSTKPSLQEIESYEFVLNLVVG